MKSFTLSALMTLPAVLGLSHSTISTSSAARKVSFTTSPLSMASAEFQDEDYYSNATTTLSMLSTEMQDDDYYTNRLPTQKGKKMSESIPFLGCSRVLQESDLAGNVGFDPLGLAKNKEQLLEYREAEIKHARLAMLAAIGWPVSEVMDRNIADFFSVPTTLDDGDRVPSVLNGGMDKIPVEFWGFCLGLSAAIDMYGVAKARRGDEGYFPGNLGFDPLGLFPIDREGQDRMKLAEIKHGRTAMVGVLGYVFEEYKTHMAVVDETPFLFQPFTETVEEVIEGVVN